jgi:hypothetical protein
MRTMTLKELVLEELNRQLEEEGRDIRVVAHRPRPRLATTSGEVLELPRRPAARAGVALSERSLDQKVQADQAVSEECPR